MAKSLFGAMAVAVLVGACSGGGVNPFGSSGSTGQSGQALNTEVRIKGLDAQGFSLAYFGVRDLEVASGAKALPVEVEAPPIDLSDTSQAWLAGRFALPAAAKSVTVTLTLGEYGAFVRGPDAGEVDVQGKPLTFTVPVSFIENGKVVVDLDLGRSLIASRPGALALVPQYKLHFF